MSRKGEFKASLPARSEKTGGLRYAARATANWLERNTPKQGAKPSPQNSTYEKPGKGAAGEAPT